MIASSIWAQLKSHLWWTYRKWSRAHAQLVTCFPSIWCYKTFFFFLALRLTSFSVKTPEKRAGNPNFIIGHAQWHILYYSSRDWIFEKQLTKYLKHCVLTFARFVKRSIWNIVCCAICEKKLKYLDKDGKRDWIRKKKFSHKKNKRVNISVNATSVKDKDLSKLNMCLFYYK
jgi:hypothetical protein